MGFINKLLGPNKNQIWQEIADEYHGVFKDGNLFKSSCLNLVVDGWEIFIDIVKRNDKIRRKQTLISAPFHNKDQFYFSTVKKDLFKRIPILQSKKVILIGKESFDKNYLTKGNDEFKINWIFDSPRVLRLVGQLDQIQLKIIKADDLLIQNNKPSKDELHYEVPNILKNKDQIHCAIELLVCVLDMIQELESK